MELPLFFYFIRPKLKTDEKQNQALYIHYNANGIFFTHMHLNDSPFLIHRAYCLFQRCSIRLRSGLCSSVNTFNTKLTHLFPDTACRVLWCNTMLWQEDANPIPFLHSWSHFLCVLFMTLYSTVAWQEEGQRETGDDIQQMASGQKSNQWFWGL